MIDLCCLRVLLASVVVVSAATNARAQPALWSELWQRTESEVQIARPCSRPDLTHVAAAAGVLVASQPATDTLALYDIGADRFLLATTIGGHGTHANQFDGPSGVAIDAQRRLLFVSDTNNHRVQVFRLSDAGAPLTVSFAKSIGRQGAGLGELYWPTALSLDASGNLYVIEKGNLRVQVFAPDLTPRRVFGNAQELRDPIGIAAAPSGQLVYVADAGMRRVHTFGDDGRVLSVLGGARSDTDQPRMAGKFFYPADLAISKDGTVLVTDCGDHAVQRFDAKGGVLPLWGRFGATPGALNQPRAIAVDENDRVIVLDFSGRRAQIFTPTGAFVRAINLASAAKGRVNGPQAPTTPQPPPPESR